MAWLGTWAKRVKLTIDQSDIDAALSNFPILVHLSTSSGHSSKDVSSVFDELENDANRKKIAITTSDGQTQCYVEIEKWVDADEEAWLWVKVPSVASDADTDLYLYYDKTKANNDTYVGDSSDAVVHNVWDANFKFVSHMRDDPDASHIRDSTVNANDGVKVGAGEPAITTGGKIDGAQDFDGINDWVDAPDSGFPTGNPPVTMSAWIKTTQIGQKYFYGYGKRSTGNELCLGVYAGGYLMLESYGGNFYGDTLINDGEQHYIVGIWNGTTAIEYVDKVLQSLTEEHFPDLNIISTGHSNIGRLINYNGYYCDIIIDELRFSDIVRTEAWEKASCESGRDHLLDFGSEELGLENKSANMGSKMVAAGLI